MSKINYIEDPFKTIVDYDPVHIVDHFIYMRIFPSYIPDIFFFPGHRVYYRRARNASKEFPWHLSFSMGVIDMSTTHNIYTYPNQYFVDKFYSIGGSIHTVTKEDENGLPAGIDYEFYMGSEQVPYYYMYRDDVNGNVYYSKVLESAIDKDGYTDCDIFNHVNYNLNRIAIRISNKKNKFKWQEMSERHCKRWV